VDTSKFDTQIADLQSKRIKVVAELEGLAQNFRVSVKTKIASWIHEYTERIVVQENQDHIDELERIGQWHTFQQNIKDLVSNVPSDVDVFLGANFNWGHSLSQVTQRDVNMFDVNEKHIPTQIDKSIKRLLGKTGALLLDNGFIQKQPKNHDWHEEWNYGERTIEHIGSFEWSFDMMIDIKKYRDELSALAVIDNQLLEIERAKKQANAKKLWDKQD